MCDLGVKTINTHESLLINYLGKQPLPSQTMQMEGGGMAKKWKESWCILHRVLSRCLTRVTKVKVKVELSLSKA
jgi:hypothetical protein